MKIINETEEKTIFIENNNERYFLKSKYVKKSDITSTSVSTSKTLLFVGEYMGYHNNSNELISLLSDIIIGEGLKNENK